MEMLNNCEVLLTRNYSTRTHKLISVIFGNGLQLFSEVLPFCTGQNLIVKN